MLLLASIFALWTLWFWISLAVVTVLIISFDVNDKSGRAFTTMGLFILAVAWFNPPIAEFIRLHPLSVVLGVLGYIVIGCVWLFIRWSLFLLDVRAAMKEAPARFAAVGSSTQYLRVRGREITLPVKVSNFKGRIIGWMTYWPWSALWTLLDLLFHRVFQHLYTLFAGRLQRMADRITGSSEIDELKETGSRIEPDRPWPRT